MLLTDNRNDEHGNSLQATLADSWRPGCLPVVTISSKAKFLRIAGYAASVTAQTADLLYGVDQGEYLDQLRIFVPR